MRSRSLILAVLVSSVLSAVPVSAAPPSSFGCAVAFSATTYASLEGKYKPVSEGGTGGPVTAELWAAIDRNGNGTLCLKYLPYNSANPTTPIDSPFNVIDDKVPVS